MFSCSLLSHPCAPSLNIPVLPRTSVPLFRSLSGKVPSLLGRNLSHLLSPCFLYNSVLWPFIPVCFVLEVGVFLSYKMVWCLTQRKCLKYASSLHQIYTSMSQSQLLRKPGKGAKDGLPFLPHKEHDLESAPSSWGLHKVSNTSQPGTFYRNSSPSSGSLSRSLPSPSVSKNP